MLIKVERVSLITMSSGLQSHQILLWIRRKLSHISGLFQQSHGGVSGSQESTPDDVIITDGLDPETASQTGSLASERAIDIGRVGSWATDFEKLLIDPIGLRTFAVS